MVSAESVKVKNVFCTKVYLRKRINNIGHVSFLEQKTAGLPHRDKVCNEEMRA